MRVVDVLMHRLKLALPLGNEVALGGEGFRGHPALILLPVRTSPPRLLAADGSHVPALRTSARWKENSRPGKHITDHNGEIRRKHLPPPPTEE